MRYALIEDNVVINIIEYDEEAIVANLQQYEIDLANYKLAEKQFDKDWIAYSRKLKPLYDDIISQPGNLDVDEDNPNEITLSRKGQELYNAKKDKIRPKQPQAPQRPLGKYMLNSNQQLIKVENYCNIGDKYENGEFITPEA